MSVVKIVPMPGVPGIQSEDSFNHISNLDYAQFDTTNTVQPTVPGRLAWNQDDGTLDLRLKDGLVTLQIGQEFVARVYNATGVLIPEGRVVRVDGAQGQRLKVTLASALSDDLSATTLGIVTHSGGIPVNQSGYVTLMGLVRGINTAAYQDGDLLWLQADSGTFSATKPIAPVHGVQIGYVVNATNNGSIYVHIQNGYELDELHNVKITDPQNGQVLKYQSSTGLWINSNI